jgi:NAD(P)H dehydrogenase (quinone)
VTVAEPTPIVAVTGAAGQTGTEVVRALTQRACAVRALVRRPEQAEAALARGADEAIVCDLEDVESLRRAFEGADAVLVIPPILHPHEDRLVANARDACVLGGVERVVYHSALHPYTPSMAHHLAKARAEAELRDSNLIWTILQPGMYCQTPLRGFLASSDQDELAVPYGLDSRFAAVDLADVAEATARVLVDGIGAYGSYELAGPQLLTPRDMAAALSARLGRDVTAKRVAPWSLPLGPKFEPRFSNIVAMCEEYDRRGLVGNGDVLRLLLEREATTFAQVVARLLPMSAPV